MCVLVDKRAVSRQEIVEHATCCGRETETLVSPEYTPRRPPLDYCFPVCPSVHHESIRLLSEIHDRRSLHSHICKLYLPVHRKQVFYYPVEINIFILLGLIPRFFVKLFKCMSFVTVSYIFHILGI